MADFSLSALRAEIKAHPDKYYVYVLSRPDGRPFYVGLGRGRRILQSIQPRNCQGNPVKLAIIEKILASGSLVSWEITSWWNNREAAAAEEIRLIGRYGRRIDGSGVLTNITAGGEGFVGVTRAPPSEETRRKMSLSAKARIRAPEDIAGMLAWGEANRAKVGKQISEKWQDPKYRERMHASLRGVKRAPEHVAANRERQIAKFQDPEFLARWNAARRLAVNTPEYRKRMSDATRASWQRRKKLKSPA
jgi:hypothetical protein